MRLILQGSSFPIRHKIKKRRTFVLLFSVPPQGLDCVTYSYAIVYSILTFPLNPPLAKGGLRQGSLQRYINKKSDGKTIGLLVVPPQGLEPWTPTLRVSCSTN